MGLGFLGLQEDLKIKCKRVRSKNSDKSRVLENGVGIEMQQVNGKGEVVDFAELERKGDELYSEELKRRTVGLETEEGVLGFLWDLEGQWCSRRKRRKYVDAGLFGDALPIGWKLLLGLRRCDYRVSVYCRRYIRWSRLKNSKLILILARAIAAIFTYKNAYSLYVLGLEMMRHYPRTRTYRLIPVLHCRAMPVEFF